MKDKVGRILLDKRIKTVLPHIEGYLLDIGCGTNELLRSYSGKGIGVDVYQWGDVDIVVEDTAKLPFDDKSFDTITIIAALNHIPNRVQVLIEVKRLLRDSGKLIVTMIPPKISRVWHRIRKPWDVDQSERGMKEGEVYGMTEDELRKLLSETGFEIKFTKKFMLGINNLTITKKKSEV
jgi:ubiquinone/menaquinone biosynthesis C-methylase UbiE